MVGSGEVKRFTPVAFNEVMIGLTCGYEWGPAVGGDYEAPFAFNGTIVRAEVTATGPVDARPGGGGGGDPRLAVSRRGRHPGGVTRSSGPRSRVRLSSKKPSVWVQSSTPSQRRPAASPLGAGVTTGPKMAVPL